MCDEGSAQALSREWKEEMSLSITLRMYCAAHSYQFSERILFAGEHWSTQKLTKHTKRVIDLSHHLAQKNNTKTAGYSSGFNGKTCAYLCYKHRRQ